MEDKRTEFLEVLNEVLKKVGLPSFFETVQRKKVYGDNSHFTVYRFVLDSTIRVVFEIEFDENGYSKSASVAKQFDSHDTWEYGYSWKLEGNPNPVLLE